MTLEHICSLEMLEVVSSFAAQIHYKAVLVVDALCHINNWNNSIPWIYTELENLEVLRIFILAVSVKCNIHQGTFLSLTDNVRWFIYS